MCLFPHLSSTRQLPGGLLFVWFWAAMLGVGSVDAATLTVTTTADNGAGSLRTTITAASDGDTIQFAAALNGQTISLTGGQLVVDKNITISGPGPNLLAVSRASNAAPFRIFYIMPGHVVAIQGLTIRGGTASGELGGGIWNDDAAILTINNCTVSGNFSDGGDGGGGIYSTGTLTIVNSIVSNNMAGFSFGNPTGDGGGIRIGGTLTIIHSTITGNTAVFNGGGIFGGGTVTITDSTVSGNRAGSNSFSFSGYGGGLYIGGMVEIRNSTVSGNTASGNGSGIGGGIVSSGMLTISNSTLSGNFSNQDGGAILSDGPLTITNSTISDNRANQNGGGIINYASLVIGSTILKTGGGANIFNSGGTVTSRGYNLSSDSGGGFLTAIGDQINTNPMLGPLQDNGGPTLTHGPLNGSPAIDAGDPNFTPPPVYDQRGYARVFNGRIDIGSLEVQPPPAPTPTPRATVTPTATPTATATPTPTLTPPPLLSISGTVLYCSNPVPSAVANVKLTITGNASSATLSDSSGNYTFSSLPSGGNYTVTPTKAARQPGSANINTVDVIATQQHYLNLGTPLSGCRLTAADVNGDSSVNTIDVIAIQRFFLGLSTGIANTGKYQFNPVSRSYPGIVSNQTGQNYDTLVFGDTASSFVERVDGPSQTAAGDTGAIAPEVPSTVTTLTLPDAAIDQSGTSSTGVVSTSAIDAKSNLVGFQGDFTFDSRVVAFEGEPVRKAGITGGNWNVSGNVLPGPGPIRTLRISAYTNDLKPLSGEGTLFELSRIHAVGDKIEMFEMM